jgi:hypothetical protein
MILLVTHVKYNNTITTSSQNPRNQSCKGKFTKKKIKKSWYVFDIIVAFVVII